MATTTYKTINVLPGTQEYYETFEVSATDDTLDRPTIYLDTKLG